MPLKKGKSKEAISHNIRLLFGAAFMAQFADVMRNRLFALSLLQRHTPSLVKMFAHRADGRLCEILESRMHLSAGVFRIEASGRADLFVARLALPKTVDHCFGFLETACIARHTFLLCVECTTV